MSSDLERWRADTYSTKEPQTLEWIDRLFRPGDVFYDVGANVGVYSLYAAKRLGSRCKVFAFEPEAVNHARLSLNIHLNGLSGVVVPCCLALNDMLRFDRLHVHPKDGGPGRPPDGPVAGAALHSFGAPVDQEGVSYAAVLEQGMLGVPLDVLWSEWGLPFPNHLKIDVDGLEEEVIRGANATLRDRRLRSVLIETATAKAGHEGFLPGILGSMGFQPVADLAGNSSYFFRGVRHEGPENTVFVRGKDLA